MRWLAGALSIVLLLAGCAHTVEGAAQPAATALKILPTEDEITSAAGNILSTFGFQPFIGGVEILPDGYRTDADASPIRCAAVTDTAPRIVYEPLPVVEAARQSYFNWDEGVDTSGADAAVVRLSTAEAAHDAFGSFARQWQQCSGTTVVKNVRETVIDADIADVTMQGSVLSATVRTHQRPSATTSRYERALGVRGNTVVEVSLAITATGERQPDPRAGAVRVAELMLNKTQ
jgi:PknH-like extracellular domain